MKTETVKTVGRFVAIVTIGASTVGEGNSRGLYDPIPDPGPTPTEIAQNLGSSMAGDSGGIVNHDCLTAIQSGCYLA